MIVLAIMIYIGTGLGICIAANDGDLKKATRSEILLVAIWPVLVIAAIIHAMLRDFTGDTK